MEQNLKDLYQQMAELTRPQCEKDCSRIRGYIGGCCDPMYCEIAVEFAKMNGLEIKETKNETGCLVPPWARPMCTLHICDKSLFDKEFAKKYFDLRNKIDFYQNEEFLSTGEIDWFTVTKNKS